MSDSDKPDESSTPPGPIAYLSDLALDFLRQGDYVSVSPVPSEVDRHAVYLQKTTAADSPEPQWPVRCWCCGTSNWPGDEEPTPVDPMDTPLPCDVTVGHGTMRKGVALRTLVTRMKVLYEMATGNNADEVANRTLEERQRLFEQSELGTLTSKVSEGQHVLTVAGRPNDPKYAKVFVGPPAFTETVCLDAGTKLYARPMGTPSIDWAPIHKLIVEYAMHFVDATNHQAASKADISTSAALHTLVKLRNLLGIKEEQT